jgi:hypothetical protein
LCMEKWDWNKNSLKQSGFVCVKPELTAMKIFDTWVLKENYVVYTKVIKLYS